MWAELAAGLVLQDRARGQSTGLQEWGWMQDLKVLSVPCRALALEQRAA
uniref:Uncharacterized protein n=1 Tax=Mus musculus TaxID=10090 RepID=Q3TNV0_MOUSE|nr:unnamed protein product [Mus musculus]BAE37987.1 unnamed protein product [Mus musculus]